MPYQFADGAEDASDARGSSVCLFVGPTEASPPRPLDRSAAVVALSLDDATIGPGESAVDSPPVSLATVSALLARREEHETAARDEHDRFLWAHSPRRVAEQSARPLASEFGHGLLVHLRQACAEAGLPLLQKEYWPHARAMAACLTHDVDVVRRGKLLRGVAVRDVTAALSSVAHGRMGKATRQVAAMARTAAGQDPYWTFDHIAALEHEHGYRSTYFFMAGRRHPEDASYSLSDPAIAGLLCGLADAGCEIALHGSYASYRDPESLGAQKRLLESHLNGAVTGHRNHYLRFRTPESWRAQEAAGFSYDASLGFADQEGFRNGHAFPFHPFDLDSHRTLDLLEIPLAVMDVTLSKYRQLRGQGAWDAVRRALDQTRAVNGLATLLWHNHTFYEPECPGSARLYQEALAWISDNHAHVATGEEIDRWWRAREAIKLTALPGGRTGWRMETPLAIEGLVLRLSLPDRWSAPRVHTASPITPWREGDDHLLEFPTLPAGSSVDILVKDFGR